MIKREIDYYKEIQSIKTKLLSRKDFHNKILFMQIDCENQGIIDYNKLNL